MSRLPLALLAVSAIAACSASAQNLLVDPGFDGGLEGWTPDAGAVVAYSPLDEGGSPFSGSALVTNGAAAANAALGLSQCVPVSGGLEYSVSARFYVPSGQASSASARVWAALFPAAGCTGTQVSAFGNGTAKITSFDRWGSIGTGFVALPANAVSARVSVWLQKIEAGGSVRANFDDPAFGPKGVLTVPASASIHGQNQTFFHTDLWLVNGSPRLPLAVQLKHSCFAGQACTGAGVSIVLPPRTSRLFTDVLASLFHDVETAGAIVLTWPSADGRLTAVSRTYSPSLPSPTTGSGIPALGPGEARTRAVLAGLSGSGGATQAGFRTNVGAYNPGTSAATVTFTIFGGDGGAIGSAVTRTLGPLQPVQVNDIFSASGAGDVEAADAFVVVASTSPVFSYATVIDNQSADSFVVTGSEDAP